MMANFTTQVIKDSFLRLLYHYPLNEITVRMIVEECGINRNSFYYHFQDIPSLLDEIFRDKIDALMKKYTDIQIFEECFTAAITDILGDKKLVRHIYYGSPSKEAFERFLLNACDYLVRSYMDIVSAGLNISDSDRNIIVRLYRGECFGFVSEWLLGGMKDDVLLSFHRVCELHSGMMEKVLNRAHNDEPNSDHIVSAGVPV